MTNTISNTLRNSSAIIVFSLLLSFNANAQTCAAQPTCESLGFTNTTADCKDKALKCPFDNTKLFCGGTMIGSVGDFYYVGGTVSSTQLSGKTLMGIVAGCSTTTLNSGGNSIGIPAVIMYPYQFSGNWWAARSYCAAWGGVLESKPKWVDKINSALSKLGRPALATSDIWGDEYNATGAYLWTGGTGRGTDKGATGNAICVKLINQ